MVADNRKAIAQRAAKQGSSEIWNEYALFFIRFNDPSGRPCVEQLCQILQSLRRINQQSWD